MNLDDPSFFDITDPQKMLQQIEELPVQLQSAWDLGARLDLPGWEGVRRVVIAGMGGSAIGADLLAAYAAPTGRLPLYVHRDYGLPAWADGEDTLVIACSHSGNTEETVSSYNAALERGCKLLVITTGGHLAEAASQAGIPAWLFQHQGQPRAAVGYSFGLLLAACARLDILPDPAKEIKAAVKAMQRQQNNLRASVQVVNNPAKRLAGQFVDRWVVVIGSGIMAPVARRWKGQINELAKAWAEFDILPEADHNSLVGLVNPEELLQRSMAIFLRSSSDHPRNLLRSDLTRRAFMLEGINTDIFDALGDSPMAQQWTALHFGDYTAYYLAMAYGVDPTPVDAIRNLKMEMERGRPGAAA